MKRKTKTLARRHAAMPESPEALVVRVLAAWRSSLSPSTRRAYARDLLAFGATVAAGDEREAALALLLPAGVPSTADAALARERVLAWVAEMRRARLAPATIARRVAALRSLAGEAQSWGLPWGLHLGRRKLPRVTPYRDVAGPGAAAVERALEGLSDAPRDARDRAVLLLLYDAALRRAAVAALELADFDGGEPPAVWYRPKGNVDEKRRKTISGRCADAIDAWIEHRGRAPGPLFTSIDGARGRPSDGLTPDAIASIVRSRGLGHPHGLRHAAATEIAKRTRSVFHVQHLLDHKSISTSQVYVDRVDDLAGEASRILAGEEEPE